MSSRQQSISQNTPAPVTRAISRAARSETPASAILADLATASPVNPSKRAAMAAHLAKYPPRFTFNENDYPGRVIPIRATITDREVNTQITKTMMIPVDKIGRLSRQVMERTWPSSQPPRPIDWLNLEYDPFATKPRISAIVAHLGGDVAPEKCTECDAGKIFHTCRVNPVWLSQKGACTSCPFHGKAKSCSFHPGKSQLPALVLLFAIY